MKIGFELKLGIGIVVVFGLLLLGFALYEPLRFKVQVARLEYDEPLVVKDAFYYLAARGESGYQAIKDFCRRHTDHHWGKIGHRARIRIYTDGYLFNQIPLGDYMDDYHPEDLKEWGINPNARLGQTKREPFIYMEIKNVGKQPFEIIDSAGEGHDVSYNLEAVFPHERLLRVIFYQGHAWEGGKILKSGEAHSGKISIYEVSHLGLHGPGLYYLSIEYDGADSLEPRPKWATTISNRICFAILP